MSTELCDNHTTADKVKFFALSNWNQNNRIFVPGRRVPKATLVVVVVVVNSSLRVQKALRLS